jgi:hypothetical protein
MKGKLMTSMEGKVLACMKIKELTCMKAEDTSKKEKLMKWSVLICMRG